MVSRGSCSGVLARGRKQELSGSLATHAMPLPVPRPRPRRQNLALAIPPLLPPGPTDRRHYMTSGLTHGLSCLRFTNDVAAAPARFASGWQATPLPGGGRTLWLILKGFRIYIPFSFSGLALTQLGFIRKPTRFSAMTFAPFRSPSIGVGTTPTSAASPTTVPDPTSSRSRTTGCSLGLFPASTHFDESPESSRKKGCKIADQRRNCTGSTL